MSRWVLYTKVGCSLCGDAEVLLRPLAELHGAVLEVADVRTAPSALAQATVPILAIDGRLVQQGRIDREALSRFLGEQAGGETPKGLSPAEG